jgi:methanol--5-hydroxybenzimidazolylcobamide Co-methyltransferase
MTSQSGSGVSYVELSSGVDLKVPGLVMEFELLPDLTLEREWGAEVTAVLRHTLDRYAASDGLASALWVTPNDIREFVRPPLMREGDKWDQTVASFDLCTQAGADMLSIESTGGKELHDDALLNGDPTGSVFALGIMAGRDMAQLWDMIAAVAAKRQVVAAGDSACGSGNTAMTLANNRHIPKVWVRLRVSAFAPPRRIVDVG